MDHDPTPWFVIIRRHTGALALSLILLTSGCGLLGSDDGDNGEDGADGGDGGTDAAEAEPGAADTDNVVAEGTYDVPDLEGGSAHFEIHELKVQGELAQLSLSMTVEDPEGNGRSGRPTLWDHWRSYLTVYLVDNDNGNRHATVMDENEQSIGINAHEAFDYGDTLSFGAAFAAPPEDVETMDVYIGDYPPFTEIPLVR
ncbi:hypothetical protein J4H86_11720 [Spiractinospora alimapuensis]|uniref:hypothetical protein n=1 Tax=Spiractinospora alimapuensis TaxID=2820884 RepID=UPI001F1E91C1|nr:hypothetical protein [Spiractinospora alimapuensis]QVQ54287.1 hypothetical protein J4H86_11720 [Spiractinospora alimapuensis]